MTPPIIFSTSVLHLKNKEEMKNKELQSHNKKLKNSINIFSRDIFKIIQNKFNKLASMNNASGGPYNNYDRGYHACLSEISRDLQRETRKMHDILEEEE